MANWTDIWNNRNISSEYNDILAELIRIDGFDSGAGVISKADWLAYISWISHKCEIKKNDSIFEIGCGSGAFLYPFHITGNQVGGIDYSDKLTAIAHEIWCKNNNFITCAEAINLPEEPKFDIVISNSVFFYFPDLAYTEDVIKKMWTKAKKTVAILEVPDKALFAECEKLRKGIMGEEEYQKKYEGLHHLYFEKDWFVKIGELIGAKPLIFNQEINNYGMGKFRFNCIYQK